MGKEIRVTFSDKEMDLYNFVIDKSSKSGFLKDLAKLEKARHDKLINSPEIDYDKLADILASKLGNIIVDSTEDTYKDPKEKTEEDILNTVNFDDL